MSNKEKRNLFNDVFYPKLINHNWSFLVKQSEVSFLTYKEILKKEHQLWQMAYDNGPEFVREYFRVQQLKLADVTQDKVNERQQQITSFMEGRITTGDPEFDEFRSLVYFHDWYYEYSDDGNVWRNANERHNKIKALIEKHGGIYKTYYEFMREKAMGSSKENTQEK